MQSFWRRHAILLGLCLLALPVFLGDLATPALWDDEAFVAIFARNYLKFGQFTAWDGHNLYSFKQASTVDGHLLSLEPPLSTYLTALSFYWFGESATTARLMFALLGLFSMVLAYTIMRQRLTAMPAAANLSSFLLLTNVQFILCARQCHYYSLGAFLALAFLGCFWQHVERPTVLTTLGSVVIGYLLFITHYLSAFCAIGGTAFLCLTVRTVWRRNHLLAIVIGLLGLALVCIVHAKLFDIFARSDFAPLSDSWYARAYLFMRYWYDASTTHVLPFGLMLAFLGCAYGYQWASRHVLLQLCLVCFATTLLVNITNMQPAYMDNPNSVADCRYLFCLIPISMMAVGVGLGTLWHRQRRVFALLLTLLFVGSNILGLPYPRDVHAYAFEYLQERLHPYPTSIDATAAYLQAHPPGKLSVFPNYQMSSLLFMTDQNVQYCCFLNESQLPPPKRQSIAQVYPEGFATRHMPDTLVMFGLLAASLTDFHPVSQIWSKTSPNKSYTLVDTIPVYWSSTQHVEIKRHHFGPKLDFNRDREAVYIFKQVEKLPPR